MSCAGRSSVFPASQLRSSGRVHGPVATLGTSPSTTHSESLPDSVAPLPAASLRRTSLLSPPLGFLLRQRGLPAQRVGGDRASEKR